LAGSSFDEPDFKEVEAFEDLEGDPVGSFGPTGQAIQTSSIMIRR